MKKNDAFRRAAALMAALSITVSLAAPAFAETYYYIDDGDITITKDENGQTVKQGSKAAVNIGADEEIIITTRGHTRGQTPATQESDLEGPAAKDSGFSPVVEDNYQTAPPARHESAEQQPQQAASTAADARHESAEQQPQQAAPTSVNEKFWKNTITVINNFANTALKLTLKDVKIDVSDTETSGGDAREAALSVQGTGDVEIELDGKNELKSGYKRAGLEKTSTGTLTLKDDNKGDDNKEAGSLTATGGDWGAGIGGGYEKGTNNITIKGGTVTANGGVLGAGIGGGYSGDGENITIKGGTVTATGGVSGAGIGGGRYSDGKNITITGGTVNAAGGDWGAGIGGSYGGSGEDITITGGTVTATGGKYGAGIGGGGDEYGSSGDGKNITINGGSVTAVGGDCGAGIGSGVSSYSSNVTVSNVTVSGAAQVTAKAGKSDGSYGAGATIGYGGKKAYENGVLICSDGEEIQADISSVTTGYIHHILYEQDGTTIKREWWEPVRPDGESLDLLHVETLEGDPLPFNAQQQGSTLRVTSDNLAARLHGTRQALEALREQGVEQIEFVTTLKTTTLSVEDLLAEGGSWFALEHDGLVSRQLSAAQAESLKCWMH